MTHEEKISALDAVLQSVIANGFEGACLRAEHRDAHF